MISKLPKLQRTILRKMLMQQPRRPEEFSFPQLYKRFNYQKISEDEVRSALQDLVKDGYFADIGPQHYVFTREKYLEVRSHYKFIAILSESDMLYKIFMTFLVALMLILGALLGFRIFWPKTIDSPTMAASGSKLTELEKRIFNAEAMLSDSSRNLGETSGSSGFRYVLSKISSLDSATARISRATGLDPSKIVELATLRTEVNNLKDFQKTEFESIKRELDRISSYNTTIIIFMRTFMVAVLGIGLINLFRERRQV